MKNTNNNRIANTVKVAGNTYAIYINWNETYKEWNISNQITCEWWESLDDAIDSAKHQLTNLGDTYRYTVYND